MATVLANLNTKRAQIAVLLVELTVNPKPDYSLDGEQISWGAYFDMLTRQLEAIDKAIQRASGPYSRLTRARS